MRNYSLCGDLTVCNDMGSNLTQRAPNPPEFAQPRLSRVKRRSSPARGYDFFFVCVCLFVPIWPVMRTPKFVTLVGDDRRFVGDTVV